MKPLILLVVVFALALLWTLIFQGDADHVTSGRIAMGVICLKFDFPFCENSLIPDNHCYERYSGQIA